MLIQPTRAQRARAAALILAVALIALWALFQGAVGLAAGEITVWFKRSGYQVYSRAHDAGAFYFWVALDLFAGAAMLALAAAAVFLMRSPRGDVFTKSAIATLQRRNPSGLKPLWIGLAVAGFAFAIYVAVSSPN
jgi:hypothetical protein